MKLKRILITVLFVLMLAVPVGAEYITLGWLANTDPIDGYIVYRSLAPDSGYAQIDVIPCTANDPVCCEYIGGQLPWEATFYWKVKAFNGPDNESVGFSNVVTYTTPTEPLPPPPADPTGCFIKDITP